MNIIKVPFAPFISSSEINSLFVDLSLKSSAFLPKSQIGVLVKAIIYMTLKKLLKNLEQYVLQIFLDITKI
jgi:hypothetical protein